MRTRRYTPRLRHEPEGGNVTYTVANAGELLDINGAGTSLRVDASEGSNRLELSNGLEHLLGWRLEWARSSGRDGGGLCLCGIALLGARHCSGFFFLVVRAFVVSNWLSKSGNLFN